MVVPTGGDDEPAEEVTKIAVTDGTLAEPRVSQHEDGTRVVEFSGSFVLESDLPGDVLPPCLVFILERTNAVEVVCTSARMNAVRNGSRIDVDASLELPRPLKAGNYVAQVNFFGTIAAEREIIIP